VPELVTNSGVVNDPALRARATRALEILAAAGRTGSERTMAMAMARRGAVGRFTAINHTVHRQKGPDERVAAINV